eukprot:UN28141
MVANRSDALVITAPQRTGLLHILHYNVSIKSSSPTESLSNIKRIFTKSEKIASRYCRSVWEISISPDVDYFLTIGQAGLFIWSFEAHCPLKIKIS